MSATRFMFVVAVLWAGIGLVGSLVMRRRGHDMFTWGALGAVFGPLVLPLAIDRARQARRAEASRLRPGVPGSGEIDVLVGIDGSAESKAALRAALAVVGPRLGRLAVATVVDYDRALGGRAKVESEVRADLERLTASVPGCVPEIALLTGPPADVLAAYAADHGFGLLAVGSRGRDASKALLGSVASRLVRRAKIPVLIAGGADEDGREGPVGDDGAQH